ncbi:MAG: hypothetical protein BKP49_03945 [Treponema sp. CETP13]|nr:MAG: hypothetical protein BKP49_03945 [Treponema sp. CETP13]
MIKTNKVFIQFFLCLFFLYLSTALYSQSMTASAVVAQTEVSKNALRDGNVQKAIETLEQSVLTAKEDAEKKDLYAVLASLQEQIGMFPEAQVSFNAAAALAQKGTEERQYRMLDAVRCALSCGDISSADFFLSTQLDKPLTDEISAKKKLYALWSWLVKSENKKDISSIVAVLKTYATLDEMNSVKPVIMLSLYEITNEVEWKNSLVTSYPDSPEAAIVSGSAKLFPSPFWYFSLSKAE